VLVLLQQSLIRMLLQSLIAVNHVTVSCHAGNTPEESLLLKMGTKWLCRNAAMRHPY